MGLANAGSLGAGLALTFVLGLGWGALDVTLNVFVADLYPGAQSSALNLMNGAYGLGALAGPLSVAVALRVPEVPARLAGTRRPGPRGGRRLRRGGLSAARARHGRGTCSAGLQCGRRLEDDVVDDAVFLALLGVHDEVALDVAFDLFQHLAGVPGQ